jgi:anti-sigma factor ChrR (cupin superfamily)
MMISCKEFARLSSHRQDRQLPLVTRLKWGLHLALCRACAHYNRQLGILRHLAHTIAPGFDDGEFDETLTLSEQARRKIRERIDS